MEPSARGRRVRGRIETRGTRGRRRDGVETLGRRRDGLVPGFGDQQRGRSKRRDGAHRGPTVGSERSNSRANALTRSYPREFEPRLARPVHTHSYLARNAVGSASTSSTRSPEISNTYPVVVSRPSSSFAAASTRRVWTSVRFSPREAPPGRAGDDAASRRNWKRRNEFRSDRRRRRRRSRRRRPRARRRGTRARRPAEAPSRENARRTRPETRTPSSSPRGVGDDGVVLFVLSPSGAVLVPRTSRHLAVLDDVPAHDRAVTSRRRTPSYLGRLGRDSREGERLRRVGRRGERSKRARFGRRTKPDVVTRANPRANRLAGIETGHRRARASNPRYTTIQPAASESSSDDARFFFFFFGDGKGDETGAPKDAPEPAPAFDAIDAVSRVGTRRASRTYTSGVDGTAFSRGTARERLARRRRMCPSPSPSPSPSSKKIFASPSPFSASKHASSSSGARHANSTASLRRLAARGGAGAAGGAASVSARDADDGRDRPAAFTADTRNAYARRGARPRIVARHVAGRVKSSSKRTFFVTNERCASGDDRPESSLSSDPDVSDAPDALEREREDD